MRQVGHLPELYDAVSTGKQLQTFWRNWLPPSAGYLSPFLDNHNDGGSKLLQHVSNHLAVTVSWSVRFERSLTLLVNLRSHTATVLFMSASLQVWRTISPPAHSHLQTFHPSALLVKQT
jgi:hypothetical protein